MTTWGYEEQVNEPGNAIAGIALGLAVSLGLWALIIWGGGCARGGDPVRKREEKILAWHFVSERRVLGYDATEMAVEPGWIYSIDDDRRPELCEYGMHASVRAIDALGYATGNPIVCRVRIWGDVVRGDDKIVGRHREVIWMADATKTLHEFGCWCVRNTPLADGRKVWDLLTDERSRRAVEVKELWLQGKATDAELDAARAAAWSAEWSAAGDAVRDAERAAAWSAAGVAAWSAAGDAQAEQLESMLLALEPHGGSR
jgi:hypothetical protein